MSRADDFGLHVDFVHRGLLESIDLAPSGLDDLRVLRDLPPEVGRGTIELTALGRGLGYGLYHCTGAASEIRSRTELHADCFKLAFHLSPDPGQVGVEGLRWPIVLSRSDSYILGPTVIGTQTIRPGQTAHELTLFVDPQVIVSYFADEEVGIHPALRQALSSPERQPLSLPGRTTAAMGLVVRQMLTCGLRGSLARMYLEAKVLELTALRLAALDGDEGVRRSYALMRSDVESLEEARRILGRRYCDPPTISELARSVGINTTKLKGGFKELFGMTVFGCVRSRRMQRALELLREGTCTVSEAADAVGYNSTSAFAAAFTAEHGFSPSRAKGRAMRKP